MKDQMKYDFDKEVDRRGSASYKWDGEGDARDVLQLWVADMDFKTAPAIIDALRNRVDHGIFGYVSVPDSYYESLCRWFVKRHGWSIDRKNVIYTTGVVPALSAVIKALVKPGEGVILQTPAYNCFFSSIRNNKATLVQNPLIRYETESGFSYKIDFEHLEKVAAQPENTLLILCNPHNPSGRVWTRDELVCISEICRKHGVRVVSDEIHCEIVHAWSRKYIPYQTIDESAIVCCSPSKAFNTAGLQIANIVCPDMEVRAKVDRAVNDNEVCDVNPFGIAGLQAAYNNGADWLNSLNKYLDDNYMRMREFLKNEAPEMILCDSESTYLAWADVSGYGLTGDEAERLLLEKARVRISSGSIYGAPEMIRINYACPRKQLDDALERIAKALG